MKTFRKHHVRLFAWLLVFCNIAFILALTLQDSAGTMQLSTEARDTVVQVTNTPVEVARQSWWYQNIRKLGHIPEYLALGVTASFAWYVTSRKWAYLKAFGLCAFVSVSDQMVKGLLPTREFDVTDLPFDLVGYMVGILVVMSVVWGRRRKS